MDAVRLRTRRMFLADLGRGGIALAVVSFVAACAPASSSPSSPSAATNAPSNGEPSPGPSASEAAASPAAEGSAPAGSAAPEDLAWERVNLGFVSAYLLVRAGEAAIVDTGVEGSEGEIEAALERLGLTWASVAHVILTHRHGDHAGSAPAVLELAPQATGYAGAADLGAISAPRPLTAVADGDLVFDLRMIATPGHTAGHIAVLDEAAGVLVAGDALGTAGGTLTGSNPSFTEDEAAAAASIAKLGALTFETLLVGHGEPILSGASAQVAALAGG